MRIIGGIVATVVVGIVVAGCDVVAAVNDTKEASQQMDTVFDSCASQILLLPQAQDAPRSGVEGLIGECMNGVSKEMGYPVKCDTAGECEVKAPGGSLTSTINSMLNKFLEENPSITVNP